MPPTPARKPCSWVGSTGGATSAICSSSICATARGYASCLQRRSATCGVHDNAEDLRNEYVIAAIGTVKLRDADTINKNIPTGEVELVVDELRILNESKLPPFLPSDTALTNEETRLKYRYIDLRRDAMQFNIETRHKVAKAIRDYLSAQGFFEIETPFMTRSTPEGARDYLVPSRVQPGTFYALPQSPQMFKQILMISGFDKYFQIVRCFRDEDLRADRQPEFTQIDLEMSYPQPERVWGVVEGFLTAAFAGGRRKNSDTRFRAWTMTRPSGYTGSTSPTCGCRRSPMFATASCAENLQELAINANLPVIAMRTPKVGELSRKERDDIKPMFHSKGGARVYEDFKRIANKYPEAAAAIAKKTGMEDTDLIVLGGRIRAGRATDCAARASQSDPGGVGDLRFGGIVAPGAGAEVCGSPWHLQEDWRSRPKITASCGSRISRCSSGTKARSSGWPRTIRLPLRMMRT